MFPTLHFSHNGEFLGWIDKVAIPSNRVNVSYEKNKEFFKENKVNSAGRNPLKSGQCFLLKNYESKPKACVIIEVAIPSNRVNVSYKGKGVSERNAELWWVAIPSNRVNVSYVALNVYI